jgi:hypothetical protein
MNGHGWDIRQQAELIAAVNRVANQLIEMTKLLQTISNRLPAPTPPKQ